jgi:large subunit ribosomal protein L13Ae
VFEGIPPPYDKKKRMVVPEALRVTRLRPGRRFTNLGRMCSEVGWKHWDTIKTLEAKRKTKSSAFWAKKKEVIQVMEGFNLDFLQQYCKVFPPS